MRVRQRIIVTLLILAMGTMNVGTLSVYAAETENQNVIKEEKTQIRNFGPVSYNSERISKTIEKEEKTDK